MIPKALPVPHGVQFNRAIWNSEPFIEHFLYELKARRYYLLDDSDCRTSLINLFSILDFWTLQNENQPSLRAVLSSLCIILAVNIRKSESVPLVDVFDEEEFATDPVISQRFEKPISKWNQVSEEIQNAVRSVDRFDIIAPALAWGIVQFFVGEIPLVKCVQSELDRWQHDGTTVQLPRGCLAFLDRKLPLVRNFSFLPSDLTTLVKATGVFFRSNTTECSSSDTGSIRKQLQIFTKCFLDKKLGPWMPVEEIAAGNVEHQTALIETLQKHNDDDPRLAQSINVLSRFHRNIAKPFGGFKLQSHHVYSAYKCRMLSYLCSSQLQNSELCEKIYSLKNVLPTIDDIDALDFLEAGTAAASTESSARQMAKIYIMKLPPEQRLHYRESETAVATNPSVRVVDQAVRKKKRRRRKEKFRGEL